MLGRKIRMNKLAEAEKTPAFLRFLSQYNDPLNYLLIGAALVALLLKPDHPGDAIFIFIVLTANAFFGLGKKTKQSRPWIRSNKCRSPTVVIHRRPKYQPRLVPGDGSP